MTGTTAEARFLGIDDPAWVEFVASHPDAGPFHTPAWTRLLADCYGFEARALAISAGDGEIAGGAPAMRVRSPFGGSKWVSLPFSDSVRFLKRSEIPFMSAAEAVHDLVVREGIGQFEMRTLMPASPGVHPVTVGTNHRLTLTSDPNDLHPNKGHRYSRNKAIRDGVTVTIGRSRDELEKFFELHTLTRRRHGVPVQPKRFFDLVWERMISKGNGFIATAHREGDVLAAAVYLSYNTVLVAKYHASDPRLPDHGGGYLIDWETMVKGCKEGFTTLDMGRSDPDAEGLRLYKASWGAIEEPLVYTHFANAAPRTSSRQVGEMPKQIIRHTPPWVCRALGEVLYRWSA